MPPRNSATNSQRLPTAPARERFVSSACACTEPAGTGTGAVCVERGGQTWSPQKIMNQTHMLTHTCGETENKALYSHRFVMTSFFSLETPRKKVCAFALVARLTNLFRTAVPFWGRTS